MYVGIDESNHGRFPEIFVAVFSTFDSDIEERSFKKSRRNHKNLMRRLGRRSYSFLLYSSSDRKLFRERESYKEVGAIVASLISPEILEQEDEKILDIYIDGEHQHRTLVYCRDIVSNVLDIDKECVEVSCGPSLDEKLRIVNIADEIAHWLYRKQPLNDLANKKQRRELLIPSIHFYL